MSTINKGESKGQKWQSYSGSFIEPKDHPLFKELKGWYVHCKMNGTHYEFESWNPHNSPGMWKTSQGEGWVQITEHYPLIESS
jgi:hypothetical protein